MLRGRKPTPSRVAFLRGLPGHRKARKDEVRPSAEMPQCPEALDERARKKWNVLGKRLFALGILTSIDGDLFAAWCQEFSFWQDALQRLKKLTPTKGSKYSQTHRSLIKAARNAEVAMNRLGSEYGISPSSRTRIHATPTDPDDEKDKGVFG